MKVRSIVFEKALPEFEVQRRFAVSPFLADQLPVEIIFLKINVCEIEHRNRHRNYIGVTLSSIYLSFSLSLIVIILHSASWTLTYAVNNLTWITVL